MNGGNLRKRRLYKGLGVGLLGVVCACYGLLAFLPDLSLAVPEVLGGTALATAGVIILFYGQGRGWARWSPVTVLLVAAGLRLLFVWQSPQLSDDLYRYLFDGRQTLAGRNPYAVSPGQAAVEDPSMAPLAVQVNHPHLVTIYPPGAQVVYAVGAIWHTVAGMKGVLVLLDLLCILLMMRLMSRMGVDPGRALLYAWHPLPVLEIASSGHIDGTAVTAVFAALCLLWPREPSERSRTALAGASQQDREEAVESQLKLRRKSRRPVFWSGVLLSFAILVKLFPILFLPFCFLLVRREHLGVFIRGVLLGCVLLILPFWKGIPNLFATLGIYSAYWEFSGIAFQTLRHWTGSGAYARVLLGVLFAVFWCYCYNGAVRRTQSGAISVERSFNDILKSFFTVSFVFLVVTPTLFPWYGLYMLGFLPFYPHPAGMVLSWTITLGYRVLMSYAIAGQWAEDTFTAVGVWAGPLAALLLSIGARKVTVDRTAQV